MRIAIHKNDAIFKHSTTWNTPWADYCIKNKIDYEFVNCYENNILDKLKKFDCLLWHFSNYSLQDMLFARSILQSAKKIGLKVFPDEDTAWHFDDKIAETYLLESIEALLPQSWIFYTFESCRSFLKNDCQYPVVAKLKSGSGSNNVKLIKTKGEGIFYAQKLFKKGLKMSPGILLKTKSNLQSAKNWEMIKKRIKRIPDFITTYTNARKFPREKGYAFFQEFIPNDGFDIKIVVVGDKLSYIGRHSRKGDFRASGAGDVFYDKSIVTKDMIASAFCISDQLKFQSIGFDYVMDKQRKKGVIVEISYGFSNEALLAAGGYWDREGLYWDQPLNAAQEVLKNLMNTNQND